MGGLRKAWILKARAGLCLGLLALGTLSLVNCERKAEPAAAAAPRPAVPQRPLDPWRWHFAGGVLVVEGELDEATDLALKGRNLSETCRAPAGPVRWELYRPPPGEVVELRTGDGTLLATWDLDAKNQPAPRVPAAQPPPPPPPPARAATPSGG